MFYVGVLCNVEVNRVLYGVLSSVVANCILYHVLSTVQVNCILGGVLSNLANCILPMPTLEINTHEIYIDLNDMPISLQTQLTPGS